MKLKLLLLSALSLGGGLVINAQEQQFSTLGSHTFTIPTSVIGLRVECVGAGGAGGRVTPSNWLDDDASGGGGGGAYARSIVSVVEGSTYDLFVGKGGKNDGSNVNGENSYFANPAVVEAEGGRTRSGSDNEAGVVGGQAANSLGDVTYSGGKGGNGDDGEPDGGGGGGAAGSTGNGINGNNQLAGGNTAQYGGSGGSGGPDGATGAPGNGYGGGGGGSSANGSNDRDGGIGANGFVVVKWSAITSVTPTLVCATASETVVITGTNFTNVDSILLNGKLVDFDLINATTINANLDTSLQSGRLIVYNENGISQSDSITITRNSVSLMNDMNSLSATYTGDSLVANWTWYNCVNNDTVNIDSIGSFTVDEIGVFGVYVEEGGCIVQSACVVVSEIAEIDTVVITPGDTTVITPGDTVVVTPVDSSGATGILDVYSDKSMNLYPNPSNSMITIESINNSTIEAVKIYDINGSKVLSEINNSSSLINLSIKHLENGIYFVEILSNRNKTMVKLIKK